MPSNFSYKGVSVSNIVTNNGNTNVSGFSGMPGPIATNYNGMKPLTFGYTSGTPPVDICNQYTANNTGIIFNSQAVSIPSGVKSCRVISVGGGGGTGGSSGNAAAEAYNNSAAATSTMGGKGGFGSYTYTNIPLTGYSSFNVVVGTSGTNGNVGSSQKVNSNYNWTNAVYNNNKTTNVSSGNTGGSGGNSYIILNGTSNWSAVANGGGGGGGGQYPYANASKNAANTGGGSAGNVGTPTASQAYDGNYPALTGYGNPGTAGAVQIIWLYN